MASASKCFLSVVLLSGQVLVTGCGGTAGPTTPIVREVEAAGGGQAAAISPQTLRHWFAQHLAFAEHIAQECAHAPGREALNYGDTTEAKVCEAADVRVPKAGRDGKSF